MKIEQIYTGCLAQGAYYIESDGEAAIIDPLREVQPYIEKAARRNAKISMCLKLIFMLTSFLDTKTSQRRPVQKLYTDQQA